MMGVHGTPKEVVEKAEKNLKELADVKENEKKGLAALGSHRSDLELGIETLQTLISREEASQKLLNTKATFIFNAWVPEPDVEKLEKILAGYDCAWEITSVDDENPRDIPVKIKSNKFTTPANMLTEMYSLPQYNTLDPAPFVAPFFVIFFGIMFADMAYGIILFIAGLVILNVMKPAKATGMRYMGGLCIEGGITTFIFGLLTGGFFGDAPTQIAGWFGLDWSLVPTFATINIVGNEINLPLNLLEGNNPLFVLIGAIALGAVHLLIGVLIGCYLKIKDGQWFDAIFNDLCWWVMFAGIGVYVLNGSFIVLGIGIAMLVIGAVGTGKGIGRIIGIGSAVYNGATGYLGDLLSYSRLMALMLAGSVIASVFNQLGSLVNSNGPTVIGTILFIVVFLIGHVLNFALNLIGCFVHALRLQYLEFFGKWYRDGGKPFRPLGIKTKYFNVSKEEQ